MCSHKNILLYLWLIFIPGALSASETDGKEVVVLATSDASPYSNKDEPSVGYVNEVVREAFTRAGFGTDIQFYPHARAVYLAESAAVAGVFPSRQIKTDTGSLLFSDPIPGGSIGLLKLTEGMQQSDSEADMIVGKVRGEMTPEVMEEWDTALSIEATNAYQLLQLLEKKRITHAAIDRYTASETIVNKLPHLVGRVVYEEDANSPNYYYLALSKNFKNANALLDSFNAQLKTLKEDGTLRKYLERYGIFDIDRDADDKTLYIAAPQINAIEYVEALTPEFEAQFPGTKIIWHIMEESVLRKRLLGDFVFNQNDYDMFMLGSYEVPLWAKRGWIASFDTLPESFNDADILPTVRDATYSNKQRWALPFVAETAVTYYRKDWLQEADVEINSPLTYEAIMEIAEQVHAPENERFGIVLRTRPGWGQNMALITAMVHSYGGKWFDEDWRPLLETPEWLAAVTTYKKLLTHYGVDNIANQGWQEAQQLFEEGKAAFFIDASSHYGHIKEYATFDKNSLGVTRMPVGMTGAHSDWFWSWNVAVSANSPRQALAKKFSEWLTSAEYITLAHDRFGIKAIPTGTRYSTFSTYMTDVPLPFQKVNSEFIQATNRPLKPQYVQLPEFPAVGYLVGIKIHKAITENVLIYAALRDAQAEVENVLKRAGYFKDVSKSEAQENTDQKKSAGIQ